jgi:NADPH:quinone reductase-like Zn-dependent oxidoreductase/NAD(P)-dependent dehydrogenase (short-subunit alcohol dehydrogenase family)/acyl carrier protein
MTGTIVIPDVQAVMPARQQSAHIIHPTTLDVIIHATLPMVTAQLGRGSIMPVHIDELLLSATEELPRNPGNKLNISARLESSHFRTARVDASVRAADPANSKNPVILISGIEFRSLGSHIQDSPAHSAGTNAQYEGICYELEWKPDLDYIGPGSEPDRSLREVVHDICFKRAHLSVLEVSDGRVDLSLAFLAAFKAHGGTLVSYNFAIHGVPSLNHDVFNNARECLQEYDEKVCYLAINSHEDTAAQGLVPQSFDVVLVSEIAHLNHVSTLTKKNGVLLIELLENTGGSAESWQSVIGSICPGLQVHAVFHDTSRGSTLILARSEETQLSLSRTSVRILTHSMQDTSQAPWVGVLETALRARGTVVTTESMYTNDVSISDRASQVDDIVIVADDGTIPILSDPRCFGTATALMRGPNHIIWISPDSPGSMHQITGVARTAHAENDNLRLTTIHVAQELLQSLAHQNTHIRFVELVSNLLGKIEGGEGDEDAPEEREYRVKKDGTVLVPRLHRCERLNQAIRAATISGYTLKSCRFLDHKRPLALSLPVQSGEPCSNTEYHNIGIPNFIDDENATKPLPDDFVEIKAQATAVSSSTSLTSTAKSSFGCAGIMTKVGAAARRAFAVGDRVVAVAPIVGACPRFSSAHVGHLPPQVPLEAGAALLLHTMAACYALQGLARLPPGQATVLVHGSSSLVGRAAIAAARSKGACVVVTAKDITEHHSLSEHHQISTSDIFITRPSFQRRSLRQMLPDGLDIILKTGEDAILLEAIACLKTFAPLVIIKGDRNSDSTPVAITTNVKFPPNVSIQTCDILDLLRVCPSMTASLVTEAATALKHLSLAGLDLCLHDISQASKALRLLNTGVHNQVVLQATESSVVSAVTLIDTDELMESRNVAWEKEDACYVVAGGLGDLGRRLLILMAHRGAKHFVTLSRRGADPSIQEEVQAQLEAIQPGCRLHCLACDITSEVHVKQVAEKVHQMCLPPVRGIIQSAAIFEDGTLDTMTHEDFTRSTLIKVDGTLALAAAFTSPDLSFFLMLSSVASIVGSSGQSSYNAGNAVQDALAQSENSLRESAPDCVFMSLNIGWIEDAAISVDHETRQSAFRRAGLKSIKPEELSAFLDFVLGAVATGTRLSQAVIGFDAASLDHATAHNGTVRSAMFCHVRNPPGRMGALEPWSPEGSDVQSFEQVIAKGDHEAVVTFIAGAISGQIARLISVDIERIDEGDGSILALGLDSLVAIELRNWISREFDAPLQASELLVDQTVCLLAEKVASRSRVLAQPGSSESSDESSNTDSKARNSSNISYRESSSATSLSRSSSVKGEHIEPVLPPVPLPSLTDTLRQFQESRRAIDSTEDQITLEDAVHDFLAGPGPALQQRLVDAGPDSIADDYERMLYLGRREPLQDFSEFVFGFPTEAPTHSQAQRAAILTVAVLEWARRLAAGDIRPDVVHGTSLCTVGRDWLFYATRQPGTGLDRSERYTPNQTVIVLRRGHIFRIAFPDRSIPLNVSATYAAYEGILKASEEPRLAIGTLTADDRDSWAHVCWT